MPLDSVGHTFRVAVSLCVVCSVLVSGAAVYLRPLQRANEERERRSNILIAAGLRELAEETSIDEVYRTRIVERIVDLATGEFTTEVDRESYDQRRAASAPELSVVIPGEVDTAQVRRRERYSFVYLVTDEQGNVDQLVLPIRGYGLWSTLWGFISIDAQSIQEGPEAIAIRGLTFYEHGETPGLGGEVDNPRWKALWREDKRIYDENWNILLRVIKGTVDPRHPRADYQVDGLSGATITANGVTNMIHYWFGEHGFRPFLQNAHERPEKLTVEGESRG
jgi:Na+-transporting NADH:ubiquinone oxidoreductase subunit C